MPYIFNCWFAAFFLSQYSRPTLSITKNIELHSQKGRNLSDHFCLWQKQSADWWTNGHMVMSLTNDSPELATRPPGHLCLGLGVFCPTILPSVAILFHIRWVCRVHSTVSEHVGWLFQDHGVLSKALGLQRNPWSFYQTPFHRHVWSTYGCQALGTPCGEPASAGPVLVLGGWWFTPGQPEVTAFPSSV